MSFLIRASKRKDSAMPLSQSRFALDPTGFPALLYRFFFFDWLFADLSQARNLFERHAAWKHNLEMRKHLPTYLRRWGALALAAFLTGCLCEKVFEAQLAATCCFTGFSLTVGVMAVISAAWLLLAEHRTP